MVRIGILGDGEAWQIKEMLENIDPVDEFFIVDCLSHNERQLHNKTGYNAFIINGDYPYTELYLPQLINNNILLINSDDKKINIRLSDKETRIITYGLNQKACVTASSLMDWKKIQCCIQRNIPTVFDKTICPQEFSVGIGNMGRDIHCILAAVTAATILTFDDPVNRIAGAVL